MVYGRQLCNQAFFFFWNNISRYHSLVFDIGLVSNLGTGMGWRGTPAAVVAYAASDVPSLYICIRYTDGHADCSNVCYGALLNFLGAEKP